MILLFLKFGSCIAQCTAPFEEKDGLVIIETESAPSNAGWSTRTNIPEFTGSSFLAWPGPGSFGSPTDDGLPYSVKINKTGTYRFQLRSRIVEGSSNTDAYDAWLKIPLPDPVDFFAQRDNSILYPKGSGLSPNPNGSGTDGWFKVYMNQLNTWSWQARTSDNDAHDIFATFSSPGVYTIQIAGRSPGYAGDYVGDQFHKLGLQCLQ